MGVQPPNPLGVTNITNGVEYSYFTIVLLDTVMSTAELSYYSSHVLDTYCPASNVLSYSQFLLCRIAWCRCFGIITSTANPVTAHFHQTVPSARPRQPQPKWNGVFTAVFAGRPVGKHCRRTALLASWDRNVDVNRPRSQCHHCVVCSGRLVSPLRVLIQPLDRRLNGHEIGQ